MSRKPKRSIAEWLTIGDYRVFRELPGPELRLEYSDRDEQIADAFAFDVNRFCCAALESRHQLVAQTNLSKSLGWAIVVSYYAAFFAAHALLRMLGRSVVQLETPTVTRLLEVRDIYLGGVAAAPANISFGRGQYLVDVDRAASETRVLPISAQKGGVHEQLWAVFLATIVELRSGILNKPAADAADLEVADILRELSNSLTSNGANGGNWLSQVRNRVNYKQQLGLWFPYGERDRFYETLRSALDSIAERTSSEFQLAKKHESPVVQFLETCGFLVELCLEFAKEMEARNEAGRSFLRYGHSAFMAFANAAK